MEQTEIGNEIKWVKDEVPQDDAEVVKLKVRESIEGILTDRLQSRKYETMIYKIKVKDDPITKVILGTTILDRMMKDKKIGDLVKIERTEDSPSSQGKPLQNWVTYSAK
jgi:hypothetical protein